MTEAEKSFRISKRLGMGNPVMQDGVCIVGGGVFNPYADTEAGRNQKSAVEHFAGLRGITGTLDDIAAGYVE